MISLFKVGLVSMALFVTASNILNYIAIGTDSWAADEPTKLWYSCRYNGVSRDRCFRENPPALIATGTAFNALSFILIAVAQLALCAPRFKDSFALYFVIGSLLTTLIALVFNTIGWMYVFYPQYQNIGSGGNSKNAFNLGWSFWLMTGSFASSIIAALIGSSIFGCTCVTNTVARELQATKSNVQQIRHTTYITNGVENPNFNSQQIYFTNDPTDPQVLRL